MAADPQSETASEATLSELREFMSGRWFVAARTELIQRGFSESRIKNWVRGGRLILVLLGVYSYGRDIETKEAAWRAALEVAGPGSALTGRSACEAWGMIRPRHRIPKAIEVAVHGGRATTRRGVSPSLRCTRIRTVARHFEPGELRNKDGLRLARAALSLIDLAVDASERELRFAFLEACRLGLFDRRDVAYCFRRIAGRRGAKKLRPLLSLWVPELGRIRSVLEGAFLLDWVERGFEMPKVNVKVLGYEVDMYWPEHNLALELDGAAFHSDPMARARDLAKQRYLEENGVTVRRVTSRKYEQDPEAIINELARSLGQI